MANNLEDRILDYFPDENNNFEKAITSEEIPKDFVLLKNANYSEQLKLEIEQLAFNDISFKLEKGDELTIAAFDIYVHENDEEEAINILQNLQPEITYAKMPKWKAEKMHNTISFIIVGIILLVCAVLYILEVTKIPE